MLNVAGLRTRGELYDVEGNQVVATSVASSKRVLIIGCGPSGMAMAKSLQDLAIPYDLVDRHGEVGGSFARMYGRIQLASPKRYLALPGLPITTQLEYLTVDEYRVYLLAYCAHFNLVIDRQRVKQISAAQNGLAVTLESDGAISTRLYVAVVVATGMNDHPFVPFPFNTQELQQTFGGVVLHSEQWRGADAVKGQRILVVGSGMRGIEIAEECAGVAAHTLLSSRKSVIRARPLKMGGVDLRAFFFPLMRLIPLAVIRTQCRLGFKFRGIDNGIKSLVKRGLVQVRPGIKSLRNGKVEFEDLTCEVVDVVVFATGYRYEMEFLPAEIPRSALGYPLANRGTCGVIPGLYVLGVPCAVAADSDFVHGLALDARIVSAAIKNQFFFAR